MCAESLMYRPTRPEEWRTQLCRLADSYPADILAIKLGKPIEWIEMHLGPETPERLADDRLRWEVGLRKCWERNRDRGFTLGQVAHLLGIKTAELRSVVYG